MPIIEGLEQQTTEWLQMRCGMATGSRVADAMAMLQRQPCAICGEAKSAPAHKAGHKFEPKQVEAAPRRNYRYDLVIEVLTGRAVDSYVSPAMQWGMDNEPLARAAYEIANDIETEPIGFAIHDRISRFGASPDALVGTEGLLEIKCPTTGVHLDYILAGVVPDEYKPQMLAEMACTNRQWVDFVSFDPRLPKKLKLFQRRFMRDETKIAEMERAVEQFLEEVDAMLLRLKQDDPSSLEGVLKQSLVRHNSRAGDETRLDQGLSV
jgi:hypothetical protein